MKELGSSAFFLLVHFPEQDGYYLKNFQNICQESIQCNPPCEIFLSEKLVLHGIVFNLNKCQNTYKLTVT